MFTDLIAKIYPLMRWYIMFCSDFKYLLGIILLAGDIKVLVKLLPRIGYFSFFVTNTHLGERPKQMLKFWKVRIMGQGY